MKAKIERALAPLIGMRIWGGARALDIVTIQFGPKVRSKSPLGKWRVLGTYALHLQCPWRVIFEDQVIFGDGDKFYPRSDHPDESSFDWRRPPTSRLDEKMKIHLSKKTSKKPKVDKISVGNAGAFTLILNNTYRLEVFPHDSREECWRLFKPDMGSPHFVVNGSVAVERKLTR